MKNNFILLIVISIFNFQAVAFSDSFTLKSKNIEILNEGDQINAYNGKAISTLFTETAKTPKLWLASG